MKQKHDHEDENYMKDVELWETKQLGADPKYAQPVSNEEDKALDDSLGLTAVTMRLQKELVEQLKVLAKKEGLGYQPYIRQILTRHVREVGAPEKRESA